MDQGLRPVRCVRLDQTLLLLEEPHLQTPLHAQFVQHPCWQM